MRRQGSCVSSVISRIIWPETVCFVERVAAIPMTGMDVAGPGVIGVMAWVTLRRRVRETRTGGGRLR